jgi:ribonuclease M5
MEKIHVAETIVVEGRYDKNSLSQYIDANIIETSGFGIFNSPETAELIRILAKKTGVIVLTDSDGAGFVIRNFIKGSVSEGRVLHAYIPEIPGKERRKARPGAEGLLGVEGTDRETVIKALRECGATIDGEDKARLEAPVTKAVFFELGLSGGKSSAEARERLKKKLGLPAKLSTNALLDVLNAIYSRDEIFLLAKEAAGGA